MRSRIFLTSLLLMWLATESPRVSVLFAQRWREGQPSQVIRPDPSSVEVQARVFEGDLRDLPLAQRWQSDEVETLEAAGEPVARSRRVASSPQRRRLRRDPLLELQENVSADDVEISFTLPELVVETQEQRRPAPPRALGEVGLRHYAQVIQLGGRSALSFYDKSTHEVLAGPLSLGSIWPKSDGCANAWGTLLYDHLADRWLLSQSREDRLCVSVSRTSDPIRGGWWLYQFPIRVEDPQLVLWPDAGRSAGRRPGFCGSGAASRTGLDAGRVRRESTAGGSLGRLPSPR